MPRFHLFRPILNRKPTVSETKQPAVQKNELSFETAVILITAFLLNGGVYLISRLITKTWPHYDMTGCIDRLTPFLPWTISIYFGCYLFWGFNYYLCTRQERAERNRFFCADALSKFICFLIFILLPTTNIRPPVSGSTLWDSLMKLLYQIDSADNLFPSIHCLVSWFCWIGIRKRKDIPPAYRHFSLAAALAVCISTLTTKQHVLPDAIVGILLAELCYFAAGHPKVCAMYSSVVSKLNSLLLQCMKK